MSNSKIGADFEEEVAKALYNGGFWVHRLVPNKNGQPADIIAVKNNNAFLIDAKHLIVTARGFPLDRIEDNQWNAMKMWESRGNKPCFFALGCSGDILMLTYKTFEFLRGTGRTHFPKHTLEKFAEPIDQWIRRQDR